MRMTKQQSTFKYGKVRMLSQYLSRSAHFAPPRGNISNSLSLKREDAPHFCEAGVTRGNSRRWISACRWTGLRRSTVSYATKTRRTWLWALDLAQVGASRTWQAGAGGPQHLRDDICRRCRERAAGNISPAGIPGVECDSAPRWFPL